MSTNLPPDHVSAWFDPLYAAAERDAAAIPWAHLEPCPWVVDLLAARPGPGAACIVGCGLGDDAEAAAGAGYTTTAFDVSEEALQWCRERFPESVADYRAADLLALDSDLIGAFDVVIEVRTIQSLPTSHRDDAIDAVASLLAPGGSALVVALSRPDGSVATGPPWAVSAQELARFEGIGLRLESDLCEDGHFARRYSRV